MSRSFNGPSHLLHRNRAAIGLQFGRACAMRRISVSREQHLHVDRGSFPVVFVCKNIHWHAIDGAKGFKR
jgi:hypothetical protein